MKIAFFCKDDFNLGAAYVIAYLKSIGHEVRLFLSQPEKIEVFPLLQFNPDLVCFSCVTANFGWAISTANNILNYKRVRILFGGVHPTLCPEEVTKAGFEVCAGDGIKHFGGEFDPDKLYPDREIFFKQLPPVHRTYQIFMTGFGCPFKCSYCNSAQLHRKLTKRSIDSCIKELYLLKKKGLKYVLFVDDIFTTNTGWLLSFLNSYTSNIHLPFTCFGHTKYISNEIAHSLRRASCETVWLGIQSGHEETRKKLNRHETNDEIKTAATTIKQNGLKLMIDHIFGLPFDNYETLLASYQFYKELKPDVVNCNQLLYFPKAEINKYGTGTALTETEGGQDYQRYARCFEAIPLMVH